MLKIKTITPEDTYPIRHKVLRPNQPIETCQYDTDHQKDSFHLGAFLDGKLISIASFYCETNDCFNTDLQYRLRGMATLEEYRNQKAGSSLIQYAETLLKKRGAQLWWCNARTSVSNYYQKLGLSEHGKVFEINPIGPHKLMYKKIAK
ncbi:GNAT family N-acetyltransferase [Risungbinella massiliensis]|uniref:GNAT family N-acetyltransferase n=1 Tax=Risungbinella massiliensis TaxID=1329796 RepID=UPI0005CC3D13|nr:GNAT family N-acetyltransferase [Risungbinella massiliensis]